MSLPPPSDHFDGKRFFNPGPPRQAGFLGFLRWRLTGAKSKWPSWVESESDGRPAEPVGDFEVVVTFINHATTLLQVGGSNLLTDPIYSDRASPVAFAGPKRVRRPGVAFEHLPRIDAVLLSHNHYDHMDLPTLRRIAERDAPVLLTPLGNARHLKGKLPGGGGAVRELDWWESADVNGDRVTLTPARHFSGRSLWDRDRSLWGGFWVGGGDSERGQRLPSVFFAADTALGGHFGAIRERLGRPDLALLPIGAYEPRWFMGPVHMDPALALRAHQDLGTRRSVAIHFGTFQMADEGFEQPRQELQEAMEKSGIPAEQFVVPEPGQNFRVRTEDEAQTPVQAFP